MSTKFHVGDRVQVPLGRGKVIGVISEDRGPVGVRGRHLFQVLVASDPFEPTSFDFPESEMEPVQQGHAADSKLEPLKVIDYLKHGGLVSILRSNRSGGSNQPRVWLCLDSLGNVTHTFARERGQVGGEVVPFMAVEREHIFEPKLDEVRSLLKSFDLDPTQSQDVINSVKTYPR